MRIHARQLLKFTTDQLWDILTGTFTLVFDDGEINTNHKETLYSSYFWDIHREFPNTPLSVNHHLQTILGTELLRADTHLKLLTNTMWEAYSQLLISNPNNNEWDYRKLLRQRVAEISNHVYNDLTYRCEEYVTSLDIFDFIEVHEYPEVKAANDTVTALDVSINRVYKILQDTLKDPEKLGNNAIGKVVRSGIANEGQINQCLGPRGFLTDIDSNIFPNPILVSYLRGLHSMHDSLIDSRLASKSLIFSKEPLQQAEYFSRRLQLMNQVVQNLHMDDCGSQHYLQWHVRGQRKDNHGNVVDSDLKNIKGSWYLKDDGTLDWIRGNETDLIGKTLKMRNPIYCAHKDRYGICSKCFGMLSFSVFKGANIGQYCWTYVAEKSTQSVLSVKHYDGSSVVDAIYLPQEMESFLKVNSNGTGYLISEKLKGKKAKIIVDSKEAEGITDVISIDQIRKLNVSRVSEINYLSVSVDSEFGPDVTSIPVGMKGRSASFTYAFLQHIKEKGFSVDEQNNYVVDLDGWDWSQQVMALPLKHSNMSDHSKSLANMIESTIGQMKTRDTEVSPDAFLQEFYDLVNSKLSVNLAVLSVVLYGMMIVSAADENYSLPKPNTDSGLGVMQLVMNRRSLSALLAYQGQKSAIIDPINYIGTNRMPHPFDDIVAPEGIYQPKTINA